MTYGCGCQAVRSGIQRDMSGKGRMEQCVGGNTTTASRLGGGNSVRTGNHGQRRAAHVQQFSAANKSGKGRAMLEGYQGNDLAYYLGKRIELHPATDAWARGDRYGEVVKVGRKYLHVKMDRSGRTLKVQPMNVYQVLV